MGENIADVTQMSQTLPPTRVTNYCTLSHIAPILLLHLLLPSTMMKYTTLLAFCLLGSAHAFSGMVGTSVSAFGGTVLVTGTSNNHSMQMKKGKANVPPQMRSQYARQQEMMQQREQMIAASKPGADGLPVFNLFVRSPRANVSDIPCLCRNPRRIMY